MTPDREALLIEYRLKFEMLMREEGRFSRFFLSVIGLSGILLGVMLSEHGRSMSPALRYFVCIANLVANPMVVIYYIYVRNRFYAYAARLSVVAAALGIEGYFWDRSFDPKTRSWVTLPFVGLAAMALGFESFWSLVLRM